MFLADQSSAVEPSSHDCDFASSPWLENPAFVRRVERVFGEEKASFGGVYTPLVVLAAWLRQTLHGESCRAALMWLALHVPELQEANRLGTGNYCRMRCKLPVPALRRLTRETAGDAEAGALESWRWHGRDVFLVDGTTVSMPDTPANQHEYPQPNTQKPGVGFPMMRVVLLLSLATAMVHDAAFGPYAGKETGEPSLFRSMLGTVPAEAIVVADRYYCSYWLVALALPGNLDVVFRLHHKRSDDFRQGKRLGAGDRQVVWERPARPDWMDAIGWTRSNTKRSPAR